MTFTARVVITNHYYIEREVSFDDLKEFSEEEDMAEGTFNIEDWAYEFACFLDRKYSFEKIGRIRDGETEVFFPEFSE